MTVTHMTDEQLDERIRSYLSYRAELVASRAGSAEDASIAIARRLGIGFARPVTGFRLVRVAFAVLLLILALVAAVYVGSLFRERYAPDRPRVDTTLEGQPWAVTGAYGSIWVGSLGHPALYQLAPSDGTIISETPLVAPVCGNVERGYGALWVGQCGTLGLARIDARSLKVDRLIGYGTDQIGIGAEAIWVSDGSNVVRLDPVSLGTLAEVPVGGDSLVTFGAGSAWAAVSDDATVVRIDPTRNEVTAVIQLGSDAGGETYPVHSVAAEGALWVVDEIGLKLYRIDAATNEASVVDVPLTHEAGDRMDFGDWYITYGRGLIWVRTSDAEIVGIDPSTERVVERQATPEGGGGAFFVQDDSFWLGNNLVGTVTGTQLP
jgi:streptogramin lyase